MDISQEVKFSQVKARLQQLGESTRGHLQGILLILRALQEEDIQLSLPQILAKAVDRINAGLELIILNTEISRRITENVINEGWSSQHSSEVLALQYSVLLSVQVRIKRRFPGILRCINNTR